MAAATSAEQLALISAKKTGALIRASAVAGAIMGGATDHDVTLIDDAAAQFGLASNHRRHSRRRGCCVNAWEDHRQGRRGW